jgi:hypothetical protein
MYRRGAYAPPSYRKEVAKLTRTTSNWPRRYLRDRQEMEERERELEAEQKEIERMRQPSLF